MNAPCACGCGEFFKTKDGRGRVRRFIHGHNIALIKSCRSGSTPSVLSYENIHKRLRTNRGRARDHLCACGNSAEEWALDPAADIVIDETESKYQGLPFSVDLDDYRPLCRVCHWGDRR